MKTKFQMLNFALLLFIFTCASPLHAQATDYYVDANSGSASDSNSGTSSQPWKTITKANQTLIAGDTVYIKAGTYSSYIAPIRSGASSNPITYRNYGTDTVTISNASYGILLDGKSYITVQGINFSNVDYFMYLQNSANYNTIAYCNFNQGRNMGWSGSKIWLNSSHNWVHHCRYSNYGACSGGSDNGAVLDIGNEESQTGGGQPDHSDYNLIENNTMLHGGHHILGIYSRYNVARNNYFHNEAWTAGKGNRSISFSGYPSDSGRNLFEGNQVGYSYVPCDSWGVSGTELATGYNIVRMNRFYYNDLAGIEMSVTSNYYSDVVYNKIYSNTFFRNGWNMATGPDPMTSAIGMAVFSGTHVVKYNAFKNNLYYSHYQVYGYSGVSSSDQTFAGNWNGDVQGNPKFVNATTTYGDPMDSTYPNLVLQSGSPAINAGTYLTTITSASGSGTSFVVADAGYFMDGWGITGVQGDEIQILGTSTKARITLVNYSTNTITVDTPLTWTQGQGIALVYTGSAPDAGAYEFLQVIVPSAPQSLQ